jgi:hypothetical protein
MAPFNRNQRIHGKPAADEHHKSFSIIILQRTPRFLIHSRAQLVIIWKAMK